MKANNKGMTLIEVIVVLLISSILMVIAGGILLDSAGYFNKTAQSNYEKLAVDSISSYVRERLVYATEVQIATTKPDDSDDWHWFSTNKDHQLTFDDKTVYNDDFYRSRYLKLTAKYYESYRLDLGFSFTDDNNKQFYKTTSTLELVNLKAKNEKGESISNTGIRGTLVDISDLTKLEGKEAGYKIYFKTSGAINIVDDVDPEHPDIDYDDSKDTPSENPYDGTVYDELKCRDKNITKPGEKGNNKGDWKENSNYVIGDFVEYNGVTYRAIKDVANGKNPLDDKGNNWKPVNPPTWVQSASYEKDDVVIYLSKYYQATDNINNSQQNPASTEKWKLLTEDELKKIIQEHADGNFCKINGNQEDKSCDANRPPTVGKEICEKNENVTTQYQNGNNKGPWTANTNYKKGDFVSVRIGEDIVWFRAMREALGLPFSPELMTDHTVWKRIDDTWSDRGGYEKGDVVIVEVKGKNYYFQCLSDGIHDPYTWLDNPWSGGWQVVEWIGTEWKVTCTTNCTYD